MKHTKFILSSTAFLLTIVGVVTARTQRVGHHYRGAYIDHAIISGTFCVSMNKTVTGTKMVLANTLKTIVHSVLLTVYTLNCVNKLYTCAD